MAHRGSETHNVSLDRIRHCAVPCRCKDGFIGVFEIHVHVAFCPAFHPACSLMSPTSNSW
jgi:hypothetical protein